MSSRSKDSSTASALNGRELALAEREFPCSSNLVVLCVHINPTLRRRYRSRHKKVLWRIVQTDMFRKKEQKEEIGH